MNEYQIISSRLESSMIGAWSVYLCYSKSKSNSHALSVCQYEILSNEPNAYYDEESEDYVLPETIDGKQVVGLEDGCIFGGELQCWSGTLIEFDNPNDPELLGWLKDEEWDSPQVRKSIENFCNSLD